MRYIWLYILAPIVALILLALNLHLFFASKKPSAVRFLFFCIICALLAGFVLHEIPGFNSLLIYDHITVSPSSKPYSMWLHLDKVLAAVVVYMFSPLRTTHTKLSINDYKLTVKTWALSVLVLLGPALLTGYIKFDPKIPQILPLWAVINFFLVCFSEEVIFRGFLQRTLQDYFKKLKYSVYLAIPIAAIIFGLAHYRDGMIFMILSGIAGLFYGYVYLRTNSIKCAMLVHFGVNLTHILLFTYPAARSLI
jgi:membrane protease YdiL (CAAX protease family)